MTVNIEQLKLEAEQAVAAYRAATEDPVIIKLDEHHYLELSPAVDPDIAAVLGKNGHGYIRVRYTKAMAIAEIHDDSEQNLLPVQEIFNLVDDLVSNNQ